MGLANDLLRVFDCSDNQKDKHSFDPLLQDRHSSTVLNPSQTLGLGLIRRTANVVCQT